MGQLTSIGTASTLHHWSKPSVVVREIPDEKATDNNGASLAGAIRNDLRCIRYGIEPGPIGGSMTLRNHDQRWLISGQTIDDLEDFRGSTFTLEIRKSHSDRTLQNVQFRGKLDSQSIGFTQDNNGISLNVRDWFVFADAPIEMPTFDNYSGPLSAGRLLWFINQGYYQVSGIENGAPFNRATGFPLFPFPLDHNSNPIAGIDEDLFDIDIIPNTLALRGQPLAQAFADIIARVNPNWIPGLTYDDSGFTKLTVFERGKRKRELVVHSTTDYSAPSIKCNCKSLAGVEDYSNLYNSGQAFGDYDRRVAVYTMTPQWTAAEEAVYVANRGVPTPATAHVGRVFAVPTRVFWTAGVPYTISSLEKSDRIKVRRRQADAGGDWEFFDLALRTPRQQKGILRKGSAIDRVQPHPSEYNMTIVETKSPMTYLYYTPAQRAAQAAGVAVGEPTIGFYEIQVEAVGIGDRLEVRHSSLDTFPRLRVLRVENNNAKRYQFIEKLDFDGSGSASVDDNEGGSLGYGAAGVRDDSSFLLSQLQYLIEETKRPATNIVATLWYFDPEWELGDRISRIRDVRGEILADDLEWYVEGIEHDLESWETSLRLSNAYNAIKARSLVR